MKKSLAYDPAQWSASTSTSLGFLFACFKNYPEKYFLYLCKTNVAKHLF